jgi:hypothetical protein
LRTGRRVVRVNGYEVERVAPQTEAEFTLLMEAKEISIRGVL